MRRRYWAVDGGGWGLGLEKTDWVGKKRRGEEVGEFRVQGVGRTHTRTHTPSLSPHTHSHTHTRARTHARTHARTPG